MQTILTGEELQPILKQLTESNQKLEAQFPGEVSGVQPVHVVYGGAHLFRRNTIDKIAEIALRSLEQFAPNSETFRNALQATWDCELAETIFQRVKHRLQHSPVEDYRIDFEDGFGIRCDAEEDATASSAASEFAAAISSGHMSKLSGIRVKSLSNEWAGRSIRTLEIFLQTIHKKLGGSLPDGFVVTFPKIQSSEQVEAIDRILGAIESRLKLKERSIKVELMTESPQALFDQKGHVALPALIHAAQGRCRGIHIGSYDYTASCDITAAHQDMHHPLAVFALHLLKNSTAGRGIWLSDGATTLMPLPIHRPSQDGHQLTEIQKNENQQAAHRAWRLSFRHISESLANGIYQGWDLHPAQIPVRYAAVYGFFLQSLAAARERFASFMTQAARASTVGQQFDDAATGQGLLNYFVRGIKCGAISASEIEPIGLSLDDIHSKSFKQILAAQDSRNVGTVARN
jgi:citrate lyase beta subunit